MEDLITDWYVWIIGEWINNGTRLCCDPCMFQDKHDWTTMMLMGGEL